MALGGLIKMKLLREADRAPFLDVVVDVLCGSFPSADLDARFSAAFGEEGSEAAQLLLGAKALLCGLAADPDDHAAVAASLQAAGIDAPAVQWLCARGAAAVLPRRDALRRAQRHAAAEAHHDYVHDFDWQLQYVLSSSTLASLREPLLLLLLRIREAPGGLQREQQLELSEQDLDSALAALDQASSALTALRGRK